MATFLPRHRHAAAVQRTVQAQANVGQQNGAAPTSVIMVAGGWDEATSRALNDVYLSIDEGFSWSLATGQAAWSARHGHQLVGAGGAWYIIAGQTATLTNTATQEG